MAKVRLKFDIFKPDGTYINPASLMTNISWSGDVKSPSRELTFDIAYPTAEPELIQKLKIDMGDTIKMFISYNDGEFKEHYRGKILSIDKDSSGQTMSISSKDYGMFLNNKVAMVIDNLEAEKVADKVVKRIYDKDYVKISCGDFVKTGAKYNKIVTDSSAYDVIQAAYTEASKTTNKKYMTYANLYKINVCEIGENVLPINFNIGENVIDTKYSTDISKMVNEIIVTDDQGNKIDTKRDEELLKLYQVLINEVEKQSKNGTSKPKGFEKPDKKLSMKCAGNIKLMSGSAINVKDTVTGLVGVFYVTKDKHTFNPYITEVDLSFEKVMYETTIQDPQSETTEGGFGGGTLIGQKINIYEYTAYNPKGGSINGGGITASGMKLQYGSKYKPVCAVPLEMYKKYKHWYLQVQGTNTKYDGKIFQIEDNGGAIDMHGSSWDVDLFLDPLSECSKFGRRKGGTAIISKELKYSGGSASPQMQKVIQVALAQRGKPYKWGAVGSSSFDCSGLMVYAFKVGANKSIPRTSSEQSHYGMAVSKNNLRAGDLVFFHHPVSHVGMYLGNDQYLHAPQTGDVVKISKFSSRGDFNCARRVM